MRLTISPGSSSELMSGLCDQSSSRSRSRLVCRCFNINQHPSTSNRQSDNFKKKKSPKKSSFESMAVVAERSIEIRHWRRSVGVSLFSLKKKILAKKKTKSKSARDTEEFLICSLHRRGFAVGSSCWNCSISFQFLLFTHTKNVPSPAVENPPGWHPKSSDTFQANNGCDSSLFYLSIFAYKCPFRR